MSLLLHCFIRQGLHTQLCPPCFSLPGCIPGADPGFFKGGGGVAISRHEEADKFRNFSKGDCHPLNPPPGSAPVYMGTGAPVYVEKPNKSWGGVNPMMD